MNSSLALMTRCVASKSYFGCYSPVRTDSAIQRKLKVQLAWRTQLNRRGRRDKAALWMSIVAYDRGCISTINEDRGSWRNIKDQMHGKFCQIKAASGWRSGSTHSIFSQTFSIRPNLLVHPGNCLSPLDILCLRTSSSSRVASHFYSASPRKRLVDTWELLSIVKGRGISLE